MANVYEFLFAIFVLVLIFGALSVGIGLAVNVRLIFVREFATILKSRFQIAQGSG